MTPGDSDIAAARATGERLQAIYAQVYERAMRDVPICNPALAVESVGFRPWGALSLGIVVAPWFMNLVLAGRGAAPLPQAVPGATRAVALPAGQIDFIVGELDDFGPIWTCSLFSPMDEFADQAAAVAAATAALDEIVAPPQRAPQSPDAPAALASAGLDRRALLRGGMSRSAAS